MSKYSSQDIQKQYREEVRKKTPIDEEKRHEADRLNRQHQEWLARATWDEIEEKISVVGLLRGTPGYAEIHLLWKKVQQDLRKKLRKF